MTECVISNLVGLCGEDKEKSFNTIESKTQEETKKHIRNRKYKVNPTMSVITM